MNISELNKQEIAKQLLEKNNQFRELVFGLNSSEFETSKNDKWSPGQQLVHLNRAHQSIVLALQTPIFLQKLLFGKANRPKMDYNQVVEKYQSKLSKGAKALPVFVSGKISGSQKEDLHQKSAQIIDKILGLLDKYSEEQLDSLFAPHPIIGKISLRELLYFAIYHIGHHHTKTQENLRA